MRTGNTDLNLNGIPGLAASNTFTGTSNIFTGFLQAHTLESHGAFNSSPHNPLDTSDPSVFQLILDDNRGNGAVRFFTQSPGNYFNMLQTDSAGNWVSRLTMGDPIDGTITFSSSVWDNAVMIIGGGGGGFGNSYVRITTNTSQGVEFGDALGGQFNVNNGTVFVNQGNDGGSYSSNQIFAVCDNVGGFALQVTLDDANGWGQYAKTLNSMLDDGAGNSRFFANMSVGAATLQGFTFSIGDVNQDTLVMTCDGGTQHFKMGDISATNYGNILDVNGSVGTLAYTISGTNCFGIDNNGYTTIYNRVGFYGATPVAQQTAHALTTGFTAVTGTPVLSGSTFNGNVGTTAYTIGDIVAALKNYNLLVH